MPVVEARTTIAKLWLLTEGIMHTYAIMLDMFCTAACLLHIERIRSMLLPENMLHKKACVRVYARARASFGKGKFLQKYQRFFKKILLLI